MKDQTRNLNPTPEARAAMWLYGDEYAAQGGGSMDFWDKLPEDRKEFARRAVLYKNSQLSTLREMIVRKVEILRNKEKLRLGEKQQDHYRRSELISAEISANKTFLALIDKQLEG